MKRFPRPINLPSDCSPRHQLCREPGFLNLELMAYTTYFFRLLRQFRKKLVQHHLTNQSEHANFLVNHGPVSPAKLPVITGPVKLFCFPFQTGVSKALNIIL